MPNTSSKASDALKKSENRKIDLEREIEDCNKKLQEKDNEILKIQKEIDSGEKKRSNRAIAEKSALSKEIADCGHKLDELGGLQRNLVRKNRRLKIMTITAAAVCAAVLIVTANVTVTDRKIYNNAVALMETGEYEAAISAFEAADGYKDSGELITECKKAIMETEYTNAVALMDKGDYSDAIAAFTELDGYNKSKEYIQSCETAILDMKYDEAVDMLESGKYLKAIEKFTILDGYKESTINISECYYRYANAFMEAEDFMGAYKIYLLILGYRDVDNLLSTDENLLAAAHRAEWTTIGNTVKFGTYEQDNDKTDGKEDIEWVVIDVVDDRIMLASKYILDIQPFNSRAKAVTWETCSLRSWLNRDFINTAFTAAEKKRILQTDVDADLNPLYDSDAGKQTSDKVFLLSLEEVMEYYDIDTDNIINGTVNESLSIQLSDYAIEKVANILVKNHDVTWEDVDRVLGNSDGCFWWWLRTPGEDQNSACAVSGEGRTAYKTGAVNTDYVGVRPVIWIQFE